MKRLVLGLFISFSSVTVSALECTDYVKQLNKNYEGFSGNAHTWYTASLDWGFKHVHTRPRPGDVIVVDKVSNSGAQQYGHVMLINYINSYTNSSNYSVNVSHANYHEADKPHPDDNITVSGGKFNNVTVLGVIRPQEIGFNSVDRNLTNKIYKTYRKKVAGFQATLRHVGTQPVYRANMKLVPAKGSAADFYFDHDYLPFNFYQVDSTGYNYRGDLNPGEDYFISMGAKALVGKNGNNFKPKWCLVNKDNPSIKYGCFRYTKVHMYN